MSAQLVVAQFQKAQSDHQNLANDIYNRFLVATGLPWKLLERNHWRAKRRGRQGRGYHTVVITTTAPHGFVPNQTIIVAGVGVAGYNTHTAGHHRQCARRHHLYLCRPKFAKKRLGAWEAATSVPTDLAVRRWLAQLSVNIVDFIDDDDISTPFNFLAADAASVGIGIEPGTLTTAMPICPCIGSWARSCPHWSSTKCWSKAQRAM